MSLTSPDATNAADAALRAATPQVPGLEVSQGRADDGTEWHTVTWPAFEVIMHRNALSGAWEAFTPGDNDAIGTGPTPADALRAALAND